MTDVRYPMRLVSQRTGLSPHVLRIWERRYGAVKPDRSESNRRLYTDGEIVRLQLMARLTAAGQSISQIATLPTAELDSMAATLPNASEETRQVHGGPESEGFLEEAWSFVLDLDSAALRTVLDKAAVFLGISRLAEELIVPLIDRIGNSWEIGELSVAEEHAASATIKEVLLLASRPYAETTGAPNLVVATPLGQLHELGLVLVTCEARRLGWDVTSLGPSVPATEIARAAIRNQSLVVGLSIVYPGDDPGLPEELHRLRRALPDSVSILIGGRSAHSYAAATKTIGATVITGLQSVGAELGKLREQRIT